MTPGRNSPKSKVRSPKSRNKGALLSLDVGPWTLDPRRRTSDVGRRTLDSKGFTFIEMMIVLVIIGILLSIAQPGFSTSVRRAREATLQENLFIFRDVIDQYYADHSEYPPTLEALVEARYLRKVPKDPITRSETTWGLVYDTNEDGEEEGIFDVYSGSDLIGMDGTPYQDW